MVDMDEVEAADVHWPPLCRLTLPQLVFVLMMLVLLLLLTKSRLVSSGRFREGFEDTNALVVDEPEVVAVVVAEPVAASLGLIFIFLFSPFLIDSYKNRLSTKSII